MITLGKDQFEYDASIGYIALSKAIIENEPRIKRLPNEIITSPDVQFFESYMGPLIDCFPNPRILDLENTVPKLLS